jgi:hypothetical protein
MSSYQPSDQSTRGQLLDAFFILVLLFATLFATTYITKIQETNGPVGAVVAEHTPIAQLPIAEAEKQQFEKLVSSGKVDLQTVNASVAANQPDPDRYNFSALSLLVTTSLIIAYMAFVYAMSFRQYKEVIAERFGSSEGQTP